jgi:energy-coupling factor transport system substrate-specific component
MKKSVLVFGMIIALFLAVLLLPSAGISPARHWAAFSLLLVSLGIVAMFFEFSERSRSSKEISMTAMLASVSAVARIPFAALPSVQPSSFIIASSGYVFGPVTGFMVGAMTPLISNFFLGMGPWTLFQMFAWGIMGSSFSLLGGLLKRVSGPRSSVSGHGTLGRFRMLFLAGFAFAWGYLFGFITNVWSLASFGLPLTLDSVILLQASSFVFDTMHGAGNALFFIFFGKRVISILERFGERFFNS